MRSGGFEVFSVGREAPADFFFFTPCGLGGTSNVDDDDEDEEDEDVLTTLITLTSSSLSLFLLAMFNKFSRGDMLLLLLKVVLSTGPASEVDDARGSASGLGRFLLTSLRKLFLAATSLSPPPADKVAIIEDDGTEVVCKFGGTVDGLLLMFCTGG